MEPTTGIEPVNLFLTKEVLCQLSYVGSKRFMLFRHYIFSGKVQAEFFAGAGNGIRTRDPQLGRLTL